MNKRKKGSVYEEKAAEILKDTGYEILERNYRCKVGEIDLIARKEGYLVFIEVKYRKNSVYGYGCEAVGISKQKRIIRTAIWYMTEKKMKADQPCRFDVICFCEDRVQILEHAFEK